MKKIIAICGLIGALAAVVVLPIRFDARYEKVTASDAKFAQVQQNLEMQGKKTQYEIKQLILEKKIMDLIKAKQKCRGRDKTADEEKEITILEREIEKLTDWIAEFEKAGIK